MLGYLGIYGEGWARLFTDAGGGTRPRRSIFGLLPHEIAALNAR